MWASTRSSAAAAELVEPQVRLQDQAGGGVDRLAVEVGEADFVRRPRAEPVGGVEHVGGAGDVQQFGVGESDDHDPSG
jgi:hypothetical protein